MRVDFESIKRENKSVVISSVKDLKDLLKEVKPLKDDNLVVDGYVYVAKLIEQFLKLFSADEIYDMKIRVVKGSLNISYKNGEANFYQAHMCVLRLGKY
jgi:hypothetical protein